jgi:hypothetical protein
MSVFPKTRAAAGYIAGAGPGELARARATILLARLGACEDIPPGDGDVPAALPGLLRDLVPAVRDLAGHAWLDASGADPDVAASTVPQAAASPPDPASQHPARPPTAALRLNLTLGGRCHLDMRRPAHPSRFPSGRCHRFPAVGGTSR